MMTVLLITSFGLLYEVLGENKDACVRFTCHLSLEKIIFRKGFNFIFWISNRTKGVRKIYSWRQSRYGKIHREKVDQARHTIERDSEINEKTQTSTR